MKTNSIERGSEFYMLDKPAKGERAPGQTTPVAAWPIGLFAFGPFREIAWNSEVFAGLTRIGNEWTDFLGRRLREDMNFLPRLAACKSAPEIFNVYAEFWRNLGEDYSREFTVLGRLSGDVTQSAVTESGQKRPSE